MEFKVDDFLAAALECSIYVSPTEPGLTQQEVVEACLQAGYKQGETNDAILSGDFGDAPGGGSRLLPGRFHLPLIHWFTEIAEPDFRNEAAAEFVLVSVKEAVREFGLGSARIDRRVLVERGVSGGSSRHDMELAVTIYVLGGVLDEKDGVLSFHLGKEGWILPSGNPRHGRQRRPKPLRAMAHPIVAALVARRSDGLPVSAEPLDTFAGRLDALGHAGFRMWWAQMTGEFRRSSPEATPVSACVLAAALVEGALAFVVRHARDTGLGPMGSSDFGKSSTSWAIKDLINSAASGGAAAILDNNAKARTETLVRTRQRIHAGRMLADFPAGPEDLRPEEARDAKNTAELVVRRILDWLEKHQPAGPDGAESGRKPGGSQ